jgi:hypothetical protein
MTVTESQKPRLNESHERAAALLAQIADTTMLYKQARAAYAEVQAAPVGAIPLPTGWCVLLQTPTETKIPLPFPPAINANDCLKVFADAANSCATTLVAQWHELATLAGDVTRTIEQALAQAAE